MLTEAEVRFAKPREKAYKLYDERGLFLLVTPTGSRWWRFKYYILGKERGMSLGVYPDVTLKDARERRDQLRRTVAQKVDPALQRQAEKIAQANTLRAVAEEWFRLQEKKLCAGTLQKATRMMDAYLYPRLGARPIAEIKAPELLGVLRLIEDRGTNETAHRAKQRVSQILRYAIATGRAERDITFGSSQSSRACRVTESSCDRRADPNRRPTSRYRRLRRAGCNRRCIEVRPSRICSAGRASGRGVARV